MNTYKIFKYVAAAVGIIGIIFLVRMMMVGGDAIESDPNKQGVANAFVMFAFWLLVIVTAITVVLSILNLVKNPQNLKKTLMGLAALGVLLAISYFMSSGDEVLDSFGKIVPGGEAGSTSKWVGTLITFTGILGAIGLVTIALGFLKKLK